MKKLWISIAIIGVLVIATVLIVTQTKEEPKEIKIGAILPLTGDAAIYGQEIKNGIELALEEINQKGGINDTLINIIYEDDQGQARIGVSAMEKLIKTDNVPVVIGGAMSSVAVPLSSIADKNKVVLLSPTATAPVLSGISKYFFRIWPSDNYDGSFMAEFAFNSLSLRKVCILYVNTDYGKGIEEVFKREFEKLGGEILKSESYELGTTDFRTQLTKIQELKPEAIYLPGYYKEFAGILRQAKELGFRGRFLSVNSFYDPKLLEIAGDSAEGAIFTYPLYDPKCGQPIVQSFVQSFKEKYGKEPDAFAVQGYDALKIVALAIEKGGYSSKDIQRAMSQIKDFAGVGGTMSFDQNGDVVKPLRILTVKDGKFISYSDQ
jgi:branched-chain amino acid transport system substrate-binding protein